MAVSPPDPASPSSVPAPRPSKVAPAIAIAGEPVGPHRRDAHLPDLPSRVRVCAIVDGTAEELIGDAALARLPELHASPDARFWVDLAGSSRDEVMAVGKTLGLHPLIIEDVLEGDQRAKIETTEGTIHIVLFHLDFDAEITTSEIDIVLAAGFLLTAHDPHWDPRASHHLRAGVEPILARGPDHLLWAIADDIVDAYFPFADRLGEEIDAVQDRVVQSAKPEVLEQLFDLKRQLIEVRRAISPVREVFNQLTNRDTPLVDEQEIVYFRDVYDHVIRLTDELDNYRELASATLDVYLTTVNNNLSVIMKRLTGVTVIIAGIGAIAGIFGMSEAGTALGGKEAGGFWLITALTIAIAGLAAVILRKIDWI